MKTKTELYGGFESFSNSIAQSDIHKVIHVLLHVMSEQDREMVVDKLNLIAAEKKLYELEGEKE